jgi:hypothetical protein
MTVEFVTASTNELVKTEKFLLYPKKSQAVGALSMIVGCGVLEVIAANNQASRPINLRQTERLVEVTITKELLDEPVCYETDEWRCIRPSLQGLSTLLSSCGCGAPVSAD